MTFADHPSNLAAMSNPHETGASVASCIVCGARCRFLYRKFDYDVVRCEACGLGTVTPLPSAEELAKFYAETYYDSSNDWGYHTEYGELEHGLKKTYSRILQKVERLHPGRRFERVLDVGCAYGFFLDTVEERWHPEEIVAVDVTPEARERNQRSGRVFHQGFIETVPLPEEHFDLVFMGDAFEHVHDPLKAADRFERVLAPGGVLVITTVDFGALIARLLGPRWRLMTPPEHLFFWTRASITRLFEDRGFSARISDYWLYYPKSYVYQRTKAQFGITPHFLSFLPGDIVPIPSFDVLLGIFQKRA